MTQLEKDNAEVLAQNKWNVQSWHEVTSVRTPRESYMKGHSDFKSSLQREIEKSILKTKLDSSYSPAYKEAKINGLRQSLKLLNTVEP